MNKAEFLEIVMADGIRSDAFSLSGQSDECYVMEQRANDWNLYYSERGLQTGVGHFSTESAALIRLLELLRADPSARR